MKKTAIIMGSARREGHTKIVSGKLANYLAADIIDLNDFKVAPYNYNHNYPEDEFAQLTQQFLEYDLLILATPVYWYSMSGLMKNFLDRITDILHYQKEDSKRLKTKSLAVLSCGSEEEEVEGYFKPFELTAEYLGVKYCGHVHTWMHQMTLLPEVEQRIKKFAKQLS